MSVKDIEADLLPPSMHKFEEKEVSSHNVDGFACDTDLDKGENIDGKDKSDIIQMKKELTALRQEGRMSKQQLSETEILRRQIAQKKADVKKLRGKVTQFSNSRGKSLASKKAVIQGATKNFDIEHIS